MGWRIDWTQNGIGGDRRQDEMEWEGCPVFGLLRDVSPMGLWHRGPVTWNGCTGREWDRWEKGHSLTPPQYLGKLVFEHRRGGRSEGEW